MPRLTELLLLTGQAASFTGNADTITISDVTSDSSQAGAGVLFVAIKGLKHDGADYIADALAKGSPAAICASGSAVKWPEGAPVIQLENPRLALAKIAAACYGPQPDYVTAVTGTDGKTSTADFFRQFCTLAGNSAASIGTLGTLGSKGETLIPGMNTTPDPVSLHKALASIAASGHRYVCMEASSHGLDQFRLDGVEVRAAAFTNLTRDHLDYHGTLDAYFTAKSRLFTDLLVEGGLAVLNADDARFGELEAICRARKCPVMSFGFAGENLTLVRLTPLPQGQKVELRLQGQNYLTELPLVGDFQVLNILAALGLAQGCGLPVEQMVQLLPRLTGVPGRLERAAVLDHGAAVYVDYAHTPAALEKLLKTIRPHAEGQLHVLFGCGGDRDTGKRPEMGRVAHDYADHVMVTDDNPRSEDPALVRSAILAACPNAKEIAGRKEAIYAAVRALKPGDVLVLAGKGHEKTQIIGASQLPFDDVEIAKEAAVACGGVA